MDFFLFRVLGVPNASLPTHTHTQTYINRRPVISCLKQHVKHDRHVDFMKAITLKPLNFKQTFECGHAHTLALPPKVITGPSVDLMRGCKHC